MTQKLEQLYDKYPKIFSDNDMRKEGFRCDDGWYWLIDKLCNQLQLDTNFNDQPQVVAFCVKEKFGGLRFYTQGANIRQSGMIALAENMSFHICEECGSTEDVKLTESMWIKSLCRECAIKSNHP